jgi:hypothetical protein
MRKAPQTKSGDTLGSTHVQAKKDPVEVDDGNETASSATGIDKEDGESDDSRDTGHGVFAENVSEGILDDSQIHSIQDREESHLTEIADAVGDEVKDLSVKKGKGKRKSKSRARE